ncbi:hypothetical protein C8J57DRAFT_1538119 [Mycena rebaudengoi]|nr:hypothetical protein C8J57DRAFT_1538119 [Mycena rebaudengoi]
MSAPVEHPYVKADLEGEGNKTRLVKMVQRQLAKWPEDKFYASKVTVAQLKSALLDPVYGFTTNQPLPANFDAAADSYALDPVVPAGNTGTADSQVNMAPVIQPVSSDGTAPEPEICDIRICVEDCHFVPAQKTLTVISAPILDRNDRTVGGFRVLVREIISRLQRSNGAIEIPTAGIVRISVPDQEEPDWKIPFVRIAHGQSINAIEFDPEVLEISGEKRLKLFIENITSSSLPSAPVTSTDAGLGGLPSSSAAAPLSGTEGEPKNPNVEYLQEKLATRLGYDAFIANRGRILSNPEVVQGWRFAVDFTHDYNKVITPGNGGRILAQKITKATICSALGIGSTWLSNAHTAMQIVDTYSRNKPHHTDEVIETLKRVDDPATGSAVLYNFLIDWKKEHPL